MTGKGLIAAFLLVAGSQQAAVPSDADWEWLSTNRAEVLEAVMPMKSGFPQLVAYRTHRDLYHSVHESYFAISYAPAPNGVMKKLAATISVPTGSSVQEQMLNLHMSNPQSTVTTLLRQVSMQRLTVTEDRCPALRRQFDALRRVSLTFSDPSVIVLHPTMHRFVINNGAEEIDATVTDSNRVAVR